MGRNLREFRRLSGRSQIVTVILSLLAAGLGGRGGLKLLMSLANEYLQEKEEEWELERIKYQTLKNYLLKLKKSGLVTNEGRGVWQITSEGENFLENIKKEKESQLEIPKGPPDTIIIFDIPEKESWKRKSLRIQLALLGFRRLQKSVWLGRGPLPEKFINYLSNINILSCIHIFTIKQQGTIEV